MSLDAVVAVQERSRAKGGERLVLLAIARSADRSTWECYLSRETIANRAAIGWRQAVRYMRRLEAAGELHIDTQAGRNGANLYRVNLQPPAQDDTPGVIAMTRGGCHPGPDGVSQLRHGGGVIAMTPERYLRGSRGEGEVAESGTDSAAEPPLEEARTGSAAVCDGIASRPASAPSAPQALLASPFNHGADGTSKEWERIVRNQQASAHNGQAEEWAELASDLGAVTWAEARTLVGFFVAFAKRDDKNRRKPLNLSECIEYRNDVAARWEQHRALVAHLPPGSKPKPQPIPQTPLNAEDERARRRAGRLNAIEKHNIASGRWVIDQAGNLIRKEAHA